MPLPSQKPLADEVARMEPLKENAEISDYMADYIVSAISALQPHRSDGKPLNEYMLYVWKSEPYQIGIGVYAPALTLLPSDTTADDIMDDIAPDEYEAVLCYRDEIADMMEAEKFTCEMANEGVTTENNTFGRRPYATLTVYYGEDAMPDTSTLTEKTLALMGAKAADFETTSDVAVVVVRELWDSIEDELILINSSLDTHPNGAKIRRLLEALDDEIF